jgi:hypothetical protein
MLIRCHVCPADPAGRWKNPAALIFIEDPGAAGPRRYACREHISERKEAELQKREKERGFPLGYSRAGERGNDRIKVLATPVSGQRQVVGQRFSLLNPQEGARFRRVGRRPAGAQGRQDRQDARLETSDPVNRDEG